MKRKAAAKNHRVKLGDDKVKPSTDLVYLVAPLVSQQPAYSVFMVEAAAVADGDEPSRARTVAGFPGADHAMSFVATHSEQGSWIVGVGGIGGGTVIHDPSTMETIRGPDLFYPKRKPILISLGSKVYAISRRPKVRDSMFDLNAWFVSLSFRKGISRQGCPTWKWKPLPSPPFFPCFLDPFEFRHPPRKSVLSYVTIDSHILLSLDDHEAGTCAFHVLKKTWDKVCNESLPFVGQAVPLGGSLFAACPATNSDATTAIFHMSIKASSSSPKLTTSLLSTVKYSPSVGHLRFPLFCPMGKASFCSISLGPSDQQIILTSFKINNMEAILTACQTDNAEAKDLQVPVQVKYQNQTYKLHGPSPFKNSHMPVIASLSM